MSEPSEQFDAIFGSTAAETDAAIEAEVREFEAAQEQKEALPVEESAPEPETPAETVSEAPAAPEQPRNDSVPLAVFLEQKNELKELRRQIEEIRSAKVTEEAPHPEGPPVFQPTTSMDEDPAQFLKEMGEHNAKLAQYHSQQLQELQQWAAHQSRAAQESQYRAQFTNAVNGAEEQFRLQTPDYDQALDFLRSSKVNEARAAAEELGLQFDEQQAVSAVVRDFATIAGHALQRGVNPAKVIYRMARDRGFAAKPTTSNVERIEKGLQVAKSSQSLGAAPPAQPESSGDFFKDLQRSAGYRK